jgi:N-acyl homoserine lactone hydrolase
MKMHALSGGRLRMTKRIFYPDAPREEKIDIPVSCFLLRHKQGNVLFDTGCHPSTATDATARWDSLAKFMVPIAGPHDNVVDQLTATGVTPEQVDVIVCSHLHPDHCGCGAFFPKATVLCHRRELEAAQASDSNQLGYRQVDWDPGRPIETFDGEHDLFGDGRIVLLPMPGHTPGMTCAAVKLEHSGLFLLASDAVSVGASLDQDYAPRNTWNADALLASMAEIRRIQRAGATVLYGHDDAQWASLRKGAEYYD